MVSSSLNIVLGQTSFFAFDSTANLFSTTTLITSCNFYNNSVINLFTNVSGYRSDLKSNYSLPATLNISSNIISFGCFIAFNISKYIAGGTFDFAIKTELTSPTSYDITYSTRGNCILDYGIFNGLFVDATLLTASQQVFVDYGFSVGENAVQTIWPFITTEKNILVGVNNFSTGGAQPHFTIAFYPTYSISTTTGYANLNISIFNVRVKSCAAPNIYYCQSCQLCYTTCPDGTFPNSTYNTCDPCFATCDTCSNGIANSCLTCNTSLGYTFNAGACICDGGFYAVATGGCSPCDSSCLTCNASGINSCLTCSAPRILFLSEGNCACPTGFYAVATGGCSPCDSSCLTCNASGINSCLTCSAPRILFLSEGNCACPTGFYAVATGGCSPCDSSCLTCNASGINSCLTCSAPRILFLSEGNCACPTGFYDVGSVCTSCSSAIPGCLVCSSPSVCHACDPSLHLQLSLLSTCQCSLGYNLSSTNSCLLIQSFSPETSNQSQSHNTSYYQEIILKSSTAPVLAMAVIGLGFRGLIGAEGAHVLQMLYFCVSLSSLTTPLRPAASLSEIVNGYVYRTGSPSMAPPQITAMNIHKDLMENYNATPALQLVVLALLAVIYIVQLCKDQQGPNVNPTRLQRFGRFLWREVLMVLGLFCVLNFSFSTGFYLRNVSTSDGFASTVGNFLVIGIQIILLAMIGWNISNKKHSNQCVAMFKDDNQNRYATVPYHPLIILCYRFVMGLTMGVMFDVSHRVFLVLILQLGYLLFFVFRNPYKDSFVKARHLLNETAIVVVIVMVVIFEYVPAAENHPELIWGVIALIITCQVLSLICLVKELRKQCCRSSQVEPDSITMTMGDIAPPRQEDKPEDQQRVKRKRPRMTGLTPVETDSKVQESSMEVVNLQE